jgi:hypothetical protein
MAAIIPLRAGLNHFMAQGVPAAKPNPIPVPPITPKVTIIIPGSWAADEAMSPIPSRIPPNSETGRGP